MKKIIALGVAGLAIASMGVASAMPNFLRGNEQVQDAFDSADYNDFMIELEQVNPEMAEHMSEFRFERMVEQNARWQAIEDKDYEAWAATFENTRFEPNQEQFNQMVQRRQNQLAMEEAMEAGDYEAWKAAVENNYYGRGMTNIVSEEDFNNMREMHELMEEGDFEAAHELAEEFGMMGGPNGEFQGKGGCMGSGAIGGRGMNSEGRGFNRGW